MQESRYAPDIKGYGNKGGMMKWNQHGPRGMNMSYSCMYGRIENGRRGDCPVFGLTIYRQRLKLLRYHR